MRRRRSRTAGKKLPLRSLGDAKLHIAGLGRQQPGRGPVALVGAGLGPLVAIGADRLCELGLDQSLEDQLQAPRAEEAEATLAITAAAAVLHRTPEGNPSAPSCITVLPRS
jgi:hypothetical protein